MIIFIYLPLHTATRGAELQRNAELTRYQQDIHTTEASKQEERRMYLHGLNCSSSGLRRHTVSRHLRGQQQKSPIKQ